MATCTEAAAERMLPYEGDVVTLLLVVVAIGCVVLCCTGRLLLCYGFDECDVNLTSDQSWLFCCVARCCCRCLIVSSLHFFTLIAELRKQSL
jgi:hypothetical protein